MKQIVSAILFTVMTCLSVHAYWHVESYVDETTGKDKIICMCVGSQAKKRQQDLCQTALILRITPTRFVYETDTLECEQELIMMFKPCGVSSDNLNFQVQIDGGEPFNVETSEGSDKHGVFMAPSIIRQLTSSQNMQVWFVSDSGKEVTAKFDTSGLKEAFKNVKAIAKRSSQKH